MRRGHVFAGVALAVVLVAAAHAQQASFSGTGGLSLAQVSAAFLALTGGTINPGPLNVSSCNPASTGDADGCNVVDMAAGAAASEKARVTRFNGTTVHSIDRDGNQVNAGTLRVDGTSDFRGAISNIGNASCNETLSGVPCFAEAIGIQGNGALAGSYLSLSPGTGMRTRWPYQSHMHVEMVDGDTGVMDVRSASGDIEMRLNGAVSARFLAAGMHLPTSTTIPAGDCDADAEVGRMRRYAKDANNITLCACQKVGGVFGWAAVPTGGDCT